MYRAFFLFSQCLILASDVHLEEHFLYKESTLKVPSENANNYEIKT
jgi:hypothetical protein